MKKAIVCLLISVMVLSVTFPAFAGNDKVRGRWQGAAIAGILLLPFLAERNVYYPPPSPSSYPPPQPSSREYSAGYPVHRIAGQRVAVQMAGWANDIVRGIVEDDLRYRGAVVVAVPGGGYYGQNIDADYVAEVNISQGGGSYGSAVVQIRIIERQGGVILALGTGQCQFYYDGTDQHRVYTIAAQRACRNLH